DGNDSVEVPHSAALNLSHSVTVEVWIKPDGYSDGTLGFPSGISWMPIIYKGNGYPDRVYSLWLRSDGAVLLATGVDFSTGFTEVVTPPGVVRAGQWYHLAGIIDRDRTSPLATLQVRDANGVLRSSILTTPAPGDGGSSTNKLYFGGTNEASP